MSSAVRSAGSPDAGASCDDGPPEVRSPSAFCEKNWSNEKPCELRGPRAPPSRNTLSSDSSPVAGRAGFPVIGGASGVSPNACESAEAAESSVFPVGLFPKSASIEPPVGPAVGGCGAGRSVAAVASSTTGALGPASAVGVTASDSSDSTEAKSSSAGGAAAAARSQGRRAAKRAKNSRTGGPAAGAGAASARSDATRSANRSSEGFAALSCS
jgi:hypothetical protein